MSTVVQMIGLPLLNVRLAAVALCEALCTHDPTHPVRHCDVCLQPLLAQSAAHTAAALAATTISPECLTRPKHSCPGCACGCHLSSRAG